MESPPTAPHPLSQFSDDIGHYDCGGPYPLRTWPRYTWGYSGVFQQLRSRELIGNMVLGFKSCSPGAPYSIRALGMWRSTEIWAKSIFRKLRYACKILVIIGLHFLSKSFYCSAFVIFLWACKNQCYHTYTHVKISNDA